MKKFESYSRTRMPFLALLLTAFVAGCGSGSGGRDSVLGRSGSGIAPTVIATVPLAATPIVTGVAINSKITATFSKDMAPASISTSTFTLACPAGTAVAGTVAYVAASRVATFSPTGNLPAGTTCTATISTGAQDTAGRALANAFVWRFTTGATPDTTRPSVTLTVPADVATNVATNTAITATFSEDMDPATLDGAAGATNFTLTGPGATAVAGSVTYAAGARTATFAPTTPTTLPANTLFTATITTGATDLAGNALAGNQAALPAASNYIWTFTTGAAPDTTPPTVIATVPLATTPIVTGVAINTTITATFSEDMNSGTIDMSTFTLACPAGTAVAGIVTYVSTSRVATFSPNADLPPNTTCTATITTGAQDMAGLGLASNFVWMFTTAATPDTTRPRVTLTVPADVAAGVATSTAITATFSEDMEPSTLDGAAGATHFTLTGPGATVVTGSVTYSAGARTATFTPTTPTTLAANTLFTATITTGATDLAGNALAGNQAALPAASNYIWTFTTGAAPDTTPPTVILLNPINLATGVCLQKRINATFSEAMKSSTIVFTLQVTGPPLGAPLGGTVTYDGPSMVATFIPTSALVANTNYTATITAAAEDLAGNTLAGDEVWTFTTGTQACSPLSPISLGRATPFGNLGGTAGTTNAGTLTIIGGDLGSTATATSAITGFHDSADTYTQTGANVGTVNGTIYTCTVSSTGPTSAINGGPNAASCTIATDALFDAQTTYNTLSLLPGGTDPGAGQLGGLTLAPGVYKAAAGSFMITGSDLTLDGQGDANAVWVFQMPASTLTVGGPAGTRSVLLIRGAQAKNVFWQVGSSATINGIVGGGTVVGTILANTAISFSTAGVVVPVTLEGRAVALGASITMTNTIINVPPP